MKNLNDRLQKALSDLKLLSCPVKGKDETDIIVPLIQKNNIVGCVSVTKNSNKYPVSFHKINDPLKITGYTRMSNRIFRKYDMNTKKCELYLPIPTDKKRKVFWSFSPMTSEWASIQGLVIDGKMHKLGEEVCNPYLKYMEVVVADLKDDHDKKMCRLYLLNGDLAKLDRLEGFEKSAYHADYYRQSPSFRKSFNTLLQDATKLIPDENVEKKESSKKMSRKMAQKKQEETAVLMFERLMGLERED